MNKPVSLKRAARIIECYGSQPEAWPAEERAATLFMVQSSSDLQKLQEEAAMLDNLIQQEREALDKANDQLNLETLAASIMDRIPGQTHTAPSAPARRRSSWTFSLAASIAVSTIAAVLYLSQGNLSGNSNKPNEFDRWAWNQFFSEQTQQQDSNVVESAFPAIALAEPSLLE